MKPSSNDDSNNEKRQRIEHSHTSAPSNGDDQHLNIAALPRFVDHTYRDFSTYIKDGNRIEKHKKCDRNFPALVHSILSNDQYSHIISWMPHGRAWKIHDKELFMEEVAPEFFGQSKYASFARQLSGWGFKRLHQTGSDFGCYYHECFLRGHPRLTVLMRRVSGGQGKGTPNMNAEPDFYAIAEHFPLEESSNATGAGTDNEGGVKKSGAPFSESENDQKTNFLDDVDIGLGLDGGGPQISRHTSVPSTGVSHQHEWDPFQFQPVGAAHCYPLFPQHPREGITEAGVGAHLKEHDDDSTNQYQPTKRHSFESTATDAGTDRNDGKMNSHHGGRKHDPPLEKCHQQQPRPILHRERGYSDPFPTSIPPFYYSNTHTSSYAMYTHTHTDRAQHRQASYHRPGPNINQYAQSHSSSQRSSYGAAPMLSAMTAVPPYYHYPTPTPHHYPQHSSSQYQDSHARAHAHGSNNMPNPNYDYTHRYLPYSNDHPQYISQGQGSDHHAQSYFLPPPPPPPARGPNPNLGSVAYTIAIESQACHPSQAGAESRGIQYENHDLHRPIQSFSPLRASREEHSTE